ncbi:threonine aldolase [Bradyrhizobium diazoefficiens]|uniref:threonine aldolase family protein n=1 Tax=Bradyrhizobium TaxID=374 RepID=UPI001B612F33|nr:low specificity L-threonine aldolase [Bradyrhizobium sp. CCBAU 45394]MBP1093392.1 threonine aldolase [Bradyrhizobium japonicum]MDA9395360.1 threonine aldolase [Bradyrhizobium sp. CCBAU 45394]
MAAQENGGDGIVDLRSDTVTLPTAAMLERMQRAPLGDDGREGDPTVRALEARGAALTGKEAALFVPSGTMGNLLAMLAHAERGGEVFADAGAHLLNSELGSVVTIAGLVPKPMPSRRGAMDEAALADAIRGSERPGLIAMETAHNGAGGAVLPPPHMMRIHALGQSNGIPVHLDGARLFNASVALGVPAARIAEHADSVMVCLSKGLSAPVGSLLCGGAAFVARARTLRKLVGGTMRQSGVVAAAGLVALETMIERLSKDHAAARRLAAALSWLDPALADPDQVQTNILRVDVSASGREAAAWAEGVKQRGILVQASGPSQLRLVTHRHIDGAAVDRTIAAFAALGR